MRCWKLHGAVEVNLAVNDWQFQKQLLKESPMTTHYPASFPLCSPFPFPTILSLMTEVSTVDMDLGCAPQLLHLTPITSLNTECESFCLDIFAHCVPEQGKWKEELSVPKQGNSENAKLISKSNEKLFCFSLQHINGLDHWDGSKIYRFRDGSGLTLRAPGTGKLRFHNYLTSPRSSYPGIYVSLIFKQNERVTGFILLSPLNAKCLGTLCIKCVIGTNGAHESIVLNLRDFRKPNSGQTGSGSWPPPGFQDADSRGIVLKGTTERLESIIKETQCLLAEPVPGIKAEPDESNALYFHVVIAGPQDSPFEGGTFKLELQKNTQWQHLNKDAAEFSILILSAPLKMPGDSNGFPNQMAENLGEIRSKAFGLKDSQAFITSREMDLHHTMLWLLSFSRREKREDRRYTLLKQLMRPREKKRWPSSYCSAGANTWKADT
ncbi:hypothetical protein ACRRTK_024162 [Alexandromys fortis]